MKDVEVLKSLIAKKEYILKSYEKYLEKAKDNLKDVANGETYKIINYAAGYLEDVQKAYKQIQILTEELQELKFLLED